MRTDTLWDECPPTLAGGEGANGTPDLTPRAHHNAPPGTSESAAAAIVAHAPAQRSAVLAAIARAGVWGATDAELEAMLGLRAQSVSPRRGELVRLGLVVDSSRRRFTPRGRPAAVWIVAGFSEGGRE